MTKAFINTFKSIISNNKIKKKSRENIIGYLFILPYFVLFISFIIYPIINGLYMSLTKRDIFGFDIQFVGLSNYIRIFQDSDFLISLKNTVIYTIMAVPGNVILALSLALLLRRKFKGKDTALSFFFLPRLLSISVLAIIWLWLYEPQWGILNYYLNLIGVDKINWLLNPKIALPAIAIVSIWWTVGYNLIILLAGLNQIPDSLYEAAKIDGATGIKSFFYITLPLLKPTMLFVLVMQVIASFQIFGQIYIMTGGGPAGSTRVLVQYIYESAFKYFEMGYAAALSYVLFFIIMVFTALQFYVLRER